MLRNKLEILKSENTKLCAELDPSARSFIDNNVAYVRAKGLGSYEAEIFRKDLIGLSMEAAIRNEDVKDMLGVAEQEFCDSVIENSPVHKGEVLLLLCYDLSLTMLIFALMQVILFGLEIPITPIYILFYIIFGSRSLIMTYLRPRFYLNSKWKKYGISTFAFTVEFTIFLLVYFNKEHIHVLFEINWILFAAVHTVLFIIMRMVWNQYIRKSSS